MPNGKTPETITPAEPIRTLRGLPIDPSLSWRAIFAGAFLSLLTYLTLTALGLGIGAGALSGIIQSQSGGQGLGLGSGIWLIGTTLISLFLGSYLASRVSGLKPTRVGTVQGLVIGALFFGFLFMQLGTAVGALGKGFGAMVGSAGGVVVDASQNPHIQATVEDLLGGLKLKSPPEVVARGVATRLLRGNDTAARDYLAAQAGITPAEADRRVQGIKRDVDQAITEAGITAAKATSAVGWTVFISTVLGSLFAALGGAAGMRVNLKRPISAADERHLRRHLAA